MMKRKWIVALVLVGTLLAGQTVYAQGIKSDIANVDIKIKAVGVDERETQDTVENNEKGETIEKFSNTAQNTLSDTTDVKEKEISEKSMQDSSPDDAVIIKDENLRDCLMENVYCYDEESDSMVQLGADGYISKSEMKSVSSIVIGSYDGEPIKISDFSGLEYAENLSQLSFYDNVDLSDLTDISPLKNLTKLNYLDLHGAGCADFSALSNLTHLTVLLLNDTQIRDLNVLKNMDRLNYLSLRNTNVEDVSVLSELQALNFMDFEGCKNLATLSPIRDTLRRSPILNLKGTSISDRERLQIICQVALPASLLVGQDDAYIGSIDSFMNEGSEFRMNIKEGGESCIEIAEEYISIKNPGKAILQLFLNGEAMEHEIEVLGIPENISDLGESIDYTVNPIMDYKEKVPTSIILTSNGELWDLYPEPQYVRNHVKSYVSDWVYSGTDAILIGYALDDNDTLWSGERKLADHIQKYDGHYALNTDHVLIDLYNDQSIQLEGVLDWRQVVSYKYEIDRLEPDECITYVLKQDGSLWCRTEVEKSQPVNQFSKVAEDVKQLCDEYYLAGNGIYYNYDGTENDYISQFYDRNGNVCFEGQVLGKYDVKEFYGSVFYGYVDMITEDGNFYLWEKSSVNGKWEGRIILNNVKNCIIAVGETLICETEDGIFYQVDFESGEMQRPDEFIADYLYDGNPLSEYCYNYVYDLKHGYKRLERNGVIYLDHILTAWNVTEYYGEDPYDYEQITYAVREDGTVWSFENGVPVKITDLNDAGIEMGNLNGDNDVNVVDLMMCLHYVSGRESLEGDALLAADINGDGIVNVVDLMRMLHYVSGRSTTL